MVDDQIFTSQVKSSQELSFTLLQSHKKRAKLTSDSIRFVVLKTQFFHMNKRYVPWNNSDDTQVVHGG